MPELFPRQALFSPNYQRVSKQSDTTDLLSERRGHDWKALPTYYDRSVMVMEGKVCTVAIALQERRAYYPPLCAGSNGEGESLLSFTVMMHFKWDVPIIHQWTVIAAEWALALAGMPGVVGESRRRVPACFYADGLNERRAGFERPREGAAGHMTNSSQSEGTSRRPRDVRLWSIISRQLPRPSGSEPRRPITADGKSEAGTAGASGHPWKSGVFLRERHLQRKGLCFGVRGLSMFGGANVEVPVAVHVSLVE